MRNDVVIVSLFVLYIIGISLVGAADLCGPISDIGTMNQTPNQTPGLMNQTENMTANMTMNMTANSTIGPQGVPGTNGAPGPDNDAWYLWVNGSRTMTGNLSMNGLGINNIWNISDPSDAINVSFAWAMNNSMRNNVSQYVISVNQSLFTNLTSYIAAVNDSMRNNASANFPSTSFVNAVNDSMRNNVSQFVISANQSLFTNLSTTIATANQSLFTNLSGTFTTTAYVDAVNNSMRNNVSQYAISINDSMRNNVSQFVISANQSLFTNLTAFDVAQNQSVFTNLTGTIVSANQSLFTNLTATIVSANSSLFTNLTSYINNVNTSMRNNVSANYPSLTLINAMNQTQIVNESLTNASMKNYVDYRQGIARLDGSATTTSLAGGNITGLKFVMQANEVYQFDGMINTGSSVAVGIKFGMWFPASSTCLVMADGDVKLSSASSIQNKTKVTANGTMSTELFHMVADQTGDLRFYGTCKGGASAGEPQVLLATLSAGTVTANAGSYIKWLKLASATSGK